MTLHEAIIVILREHGSPMTTREIAQELNKRELYSKKDGSKISDYQVHGRTKNYPSLFFRDGSRVGLQEWNRHAAPPPPSPTARNDPLAAAPALNLSAIDNFGSAAFLRKAGFTCLGDLKQLADVGLTQCQGMASCGVYAVTVPTSYRPQYLAPETAAAAGNVIAPWPVSRLAEKWVPGTEVVYYGLAGRRRPRSLTARLTDLLEHGKGNTTDRGPHKGGEILWQLQGSWSFSLWILPTADPPVPRLTEKALLEAFRRAYSALPFANRQA